MRSFLRMLECWNLIKSPNLIKLSRERYQPLPSESHFFVALHNKWKRSSLMGLWGLEIPRHSRQQPRSFIYSYACLFYFPNFSPYLKMKQYLFNHEFIKTKDTFVGENCLNSSLVFPLARIYRSRF